MDIRERNGFEAWETAQRLDPVPEGKDGDIQMESVCIEARKRRAPARIRKPAARSLSVAKSDFRTNHCRAASIVN